jgi:dihydroorotase
MSVLFRNARLLDPAAGIDRAGSLLVQAGKIAAIDPASRPEGTEVVDCRGMCLAPGLVDMRVQLREPGAEHQETLATASAAAAAGGVTTMAALPNTTPPVDDIAPVEFIARRAREIRGTRIFTYGAVTRGLGGKELTEMGLLSAYGAVAFTDGLKAIADAQVMRRALSYASTFDLLIVQHPEEPSLASGGMMNEGEIATRLGLSGISPAAEAIMVERDLRLAEITSGRIHFAHVSTGEAVETIRRAKARGIRVSCDTAPPYFALNETAVGDYRTFAKLSPPLRSEDDRRAIVEGLADGTIDAIGSDHAPHDQDSKRLPFPAAASGIVGLETLLPLSLALYHNGHMGLLDVLRKLTMAPAKLLNLNAGTLSAGAPADLVLFDLDRPWKIAVEEFRSKCKNSPFDGRPVQGRALRTYVAGRLLWEWAP